MGLFSPLPTAASAPKEVADQLQTLLVQRLISSAHLFGGGKSPGASLHADLFAEALAEAVVKQGGGLGIPELLQPRESGSIGLKGSPDRVVDGIEGPRDPRRV
jgi:hypothetical protein